MAKVASAASCVLSRFIGHAVSADAFRWIFRAVHAAQAAHARAAGKDGEA